jgi:hypothetical protein
MHRGIHASSEIRTHYPGVQEGEDAATGDGSFVIQDMKKQLLPGLAWLINM